MRLGGSMRMRTNREDSRETYREQEKEGRGEK